MTQQHPQRKSPRLQGYDYAQAGAYFVTLCTHQRVYLFGEIHEDEMVLSHAGTIAAERWQALVEHHPHIELDTWVVMPNHVHGILVIVDDTNRDREPTHSAGVVRSVLSSGSLSAVVGSYKSGVTRRIREIQRLPDLMVWQGR